MSTNKKRYKLVAEEGRWATNNNEQIFCGIVTLLERKDAYRYHLIDENGEDLKVIIEDHIVEEPDFF